MLLTWVGEQVSKKVGTYQFSFHICIRLNNFKVILSSHHHSSMSATTSFSFLFVWATGVQPEEEASHFPAGVTSFFLYFFFFFKVAQGWKSVIQKKKRKKKEEITKLIFILPHDTVVCDHVMTFLRNSSPSCSGAKPKKDISTTKTHTVSQAMPDGESERGMTRVNFL